MYPSSDSDSVSEQEIETPWSKRRARRQTERFLKGPIPLLLLHRAARLPGRALGLYLAIRHRADMQRADTVTLPSEYLAEWGIDKYTKARALQALSDAGLVSVDQRQGRTSRLTVVGK